MKKKTLVIILAAAVVLAACILPFTAFNGSRDATGSPATSDDDSTRKDKAIEKMLAGMSVEEKVGQLFMGCFYSDIPSSASSGGYELGCVLLFGTVVIFTASVIQERSQRTNPEILDEKCLALRWAVLLAGIFAVVLMGVYGPGVQASEFVYMQF